MTKTVISLCDLTGNMVLPWVQDGYSALLVDPQHGYTRTIDTGGGASITKFAGTILEAREHIKHLTETTTVAMVFGFPPCTDLAVSGARWFKRKMEDPTFSEYRGPTMFDDAMEIVHQCHMVGKHSGAPWMLENPKSRIATLWRSADHIFNPYDYTGYCPDDNYKKETWLWTGNGFNMPDPHTLKGLPEPDERIHKAPPGPERANIRSVTPMGFARAVYEANR